MNKKKIAILYPFFKVGGGEAVTVWTIEALKKEYDVSLFTYSHVKAQDINKIYGTSLTDKDFSIIRPPLAFLVEKIPKFGLLKYHLLLWYCKLRAMPFDLFIGTYKEIDFGQKGIQYIHFPDLSLNDMGLKNSDLEAWEKMYYQFTFLKKFYKKLCFAISGFKKENMEKNLTLTNSDWTRTVIKKNMGIDALTVYPPVFNNVAQVPWEQRKDGFICLSRISPVKQIKFIIETLVLVRQAGFDVNLHIIGPVGSYVYYKEIKKIQKENPWIVIEGLVSRQKLFSIVSKYKYGINGRKDEHFGIGIVEMIKSGCIVFVPNGGGQVEIVANDQLIYQDQHDAAQKIIQVLSDENLQHSLFHYLSKRSQIFSTDRFMEEIKEITKKALPQ